MNTQRIVRLLLGVAIALMLLPKTNAQGTADRLPTAAEIQQARQTLRQRLNRMRQPDLSTWLRDIRNPQERNRIAAYQQAWSNRQPQAALFLGNWAGYEETVHIYPSSTSENQVCIIRDGGGPIMELGIVKNGVIESRDGPYVVIKEEQYLDIFKVRGGQIFSVVEQPLHSPRPLVAPDSANFPFVLIGRNATAYMDPSIIRRFRSAGCTAALP